MSNVKQRYLDFQTQKKKIRSKRMQWQCSFRLTNEKIKWLWGSKTIKSTIISNYVDLVIMKMSWIPRYARKKEMKLYCVSWLSFLLDIALFLHPQTGIVFMVYDSWYLWLPRSWWALIDGLIDLVVDPDKNNFPFHIYKFHSSTYLLKIFWGVGGLDGWVWVVNSKQKKII